MNTLDQLSENYRQHQDRNPLPADAETLELLRTMQPRHVTQSGALMADCVSYEQGEILHWHVVRTGPILFVRLSTVGEFTDLQKRPDLSAA